MSDMTGERVFTLFNVLLLQLAGLGVLLFWAMGVVFLFTGTGGQFNHLELMGLKRTLYLAYPVALLAFSGLAWLLFYLRRDLLAVLTISAPVGLVVLYYFFMIFPTGARV